MVEDPNLAEFKLNAGRAQKIIRGRSKDGSNIIWGNHARERMVERGIAVGWRSLRQDR